MLDEQVLKIAQDRIQLEINEQYENLLQEVARIKAEMGARNMLHSSVVVNRVADLCVVAIKIRAQLVWQTLFRFLSTAGLSYYDNLAGDLKVVVARHLPMGTLNDLVRETAQLIRGTDLFMQFQPQLDSARRAALAKIGTEIDLFVHSLKKKVKMKKKEAASTVFNIYSPVGAIQTGDSSIANVTQSIDTQVREQLIKVLEEIGVELSRLDVTMPHPKGEIIELVDEGREELKRPNPNITKLRSMLSTVGISIQTVASMKPAYETLKQALTFLGISLP